MSSNASTTAWRDVIVTLTVLGLSLDVIVCLSPSTSIGRVSQDVIVTAVLGLSELL